MPLKKDREIYVIADEGEQHPPAPGGARMASSHPAIARRAFEIFLARGASHGRDVQDWLQAERELRGD